MTKYDHILDNRARKVVDYLRQHLSAAEVSLKDLYGCLADDKLSASKSEERETARKARFHEKCAP